MNQIRLSYKGSMDKLNLFHLLEKIDINNINQIEVEKNFNIWPETSLKFYIEFRNDDIFMISRGEDKRVKQDHHAKIENEQQIGISDFQLFYRLFEILNLSKVKVSSIESTKIIINELELYIRCSVPDILDSNLRQI